MLQSFVNGLFGCSHRRTTFPQTPGRRSGAHVLHDSVRNGTYVVCLDCGKEFAYDWNRMQLGDPVIAASATTEAQPQYR